MTAFGLQAVTVRFGDMVALDDVTVPIDEGMVTTVIGADGAGKTTTARTLAGLIEPVSGGVNRPVRAEIGYQPEASGTWDDLTVAENLDFVSVAHGRLDPARVEMLLQVTNLSSASDRLAGRLSGGMRQKLAVIMAMAAEPRLMVLDEPTTGLDPVSRADLWGLLTLAASEGSAVLVTTAYLDEAERAERVIVLDEGTVLADGSAAEIRASFQGALAVTERRPSNGRFWRRGRQWRIWEPDGNLPIQTRQIEPDLSDVVTAAALARREARL